MATTARWIAGVGLAAGVAAAAVALVALRGGPATEPQPEPGPAPAPAPAAEAEGAASAPPTEAPAAAAQIPPRFDLVRVTPEGSAVIAGRAEPGATVTILADGVALISVAADAAGAFVAFVDVAPSAAPQVLSLEAESPGGPRIPSVETAALLPAPKVAAVVEPSGTPPDADREAEREPGEAGAAEPAPTVAATAILRPEAAEVAPVEPAAGAATAGLTLASIAYSETGSVTLAGFGRAGAQVRVYVDDGFAADGAVDAAGRWALELEDVTPGVRRLRLDELRPDGTVSRRIETPFQRDVPEPPSGGAGAPPRPAAIIVQPGNTLWTLARIHYGSGVLYTRIYAENDALIGDPDLIYPGQIFVLPESGAAAETPPDLPPRARRTAAP